MVVAIIYLIKLKYINQPYFSHTLSLTRIVRPIKPMQNKQNKIKKTYGNCRYITGCVRSRRHLQKMT